MHLYPSFTYRAIRALIASHSSTFENKILIILCSYCYLFFNLTRSVVFWHHFMFLLLFVFQFDTFCSVLTCDNLGIIGVFLKVQYLVVFLYGTIFIRQQSVQVWGWKHHILYSSFYSPRSQCTTGTVLTNWWRWWKKPGRRRRRRRRRKIKLEKQMLFPPWPDISRHIDPVIYFYTLTSNKNSFIQRIISWYYSWSMLLKNTLVLIRLDLCCGFNTWSG